MLHYVFDGKNYAFCSLVFQKAGIGGNYAMSSCCIHAIKYFAIRMSAFALCSIGVFSKWTPFVCLLGVCSFVLSRMRRKLFTRNVRGGYLIAVIKRFIHPENWTKYRMRIWERLKQAKHFFLFLFELFLVGDLKKLATTAFLLHGAESRAAFRWARRSFTRGFVSRTVSGFARGFVCSSARGFAGDFTRSFTSGFASGLNWAISRWACHEVSTRSF